MIVTEEEAKKMVCPMGKANSRDEVDKCAGSECMAWIWVTPSGGDKRAGRCGMAQR